MISTTSMAEINKLKIEHISLWKKLVDFELFNDKKSSVGGFIEE